MGRKDKKGGKGGGGGATSISAEEVLRAVVLLDLFDRRFHPLTLECPLALFPVCNVPLLAHTLELLSAAGVRETYVYSSRDPDSVTEHVTSVLTKSHEPFARSQMRIIVRSTANATCAGDVLREVSSEGVIESDFVLVTGPVVGWFDLRSVVEKHRERRKLYPEPMLTCVLHHCAPFNLSRSEEDDLVVVVDESSGRLLHYETRFSRKGSVEVDADIFRVVGDGNGSVTVRSDVLDTMIDVCSPSVLFEFEDNFDYEDVRRDFMSNALGGEITDHFIFAHMLVSEYAAPVIDLKTYVSVSRNVLKRWGALNPPDVNLFGGLGTSVGGSANPGRKNRKGNNNSANNGGGNKSDKNDSSHHSSHTQSYYYESAAMGRSFIIDEEVEIARTAVVRRSQIASSSFIDEGAIVERCVIGFGCRIERGAVVRDSFLWENVTVSANATVESSILASGAKVGKGAQVGKGCIISFGVQVKPKQVVPAETRLTLVPVDLAAEIDDRDEEVKILAPGVETPGTVARGKPDILQLPGSRSGSRRPSRRSHMSSCDGDDDEAGDENNNSSSDSNDGTDADDDAASNDGNGESSDKKNARGGDGGDDDDDVDADSDSVLKPRVYDPLEHCDDESDSESDSDDCAEAKILSRNSLIAQRHWCQCGADHLVPDECDDIESDSEGILSDNEGGVNHFITEIAETIARGVTERLTPDDISMEIKSLRLSCDRTNSETARCVMEGLLELFDFGPDGKTAASATPADPYSLKEALAAWRTMFRKWVSILTAVMSESDAVDMIYTAMDLCSEQGENGRKVFPQILMEFYETDVVAEEYFFEWEKQIQEGDDPDGEVLLKASSTFLKWLRDADEESEESDDDNSDEEYESDE